MSRGGRACKVNGVAQERSRAERREEGTLVPPGDVREQEGLEDTWPGSLLRILDFILKKQWKSSQ